MSLPFQTPFAILTCSLVAIGFGLTGCSRTPTSDPRDGGAISDNRPAVPIASVETTVGSGDTAVGVAMLVVPRGTFWMGSDHGPAAEGPRHRVTVGPFLMDQYEVTQDQYAALQLPNPAQFKGGRRPVEQVRWSDAALFCNERSRQEGLDPCYDEGTFACNFEASGYRLPTEAEWEYAARAGQDDEPGSGVDAKVLSQRACYAGTSTERTDLVGKRRPNAWGFYDMQGNVAEWCHDVYDKEGYGTGSHDDTISDPRGPDQGTLRVVRGGSWKSDPDACRLTARAGDEPGISDACFAQNIYGFRCVRAARPDELSLVDATN